MYATDLISVLSSKQGAKGTIILMVLLLLRDVIVLNLHLLYVKSTE